jgi:hypothetical protein
MRPTGKGGAIRYCLLMGLLISTCLSTMIEGKENVSAYPPATVLELPAPDKGIVFGDRIRRTMNLLSTSTKEKPNKVKIVFFGQSIIKQDYSRKIIESKLRQNFPHAQLEVLNTAIGGYQAPYSARTMFHQVIPHQPDLIVFHVYAGEKDGKYEEILKNFRRYTTAEVVTITHHLDNYGEAVDKDRDAASQLRRDLAVKYGFELVEVRENWRKYLTMHGLKVTDMLSDKITEGGSRFVAVRNNLDPDEGIHCRHSRENRIRCVCLGKNRYGNQDLDEGRRSED